MKLITTLIVTALLLSPFNNLVYAAPESQEDLTQAITIAKSYFTIPDTMDDLTSLFSEIDGNTYWDLYWESSTNNQYIRIKVDMNRQEIVSYYYYEREQEENNSYLPQLSQQEAQNLALEQVKELTGFSEDELLDVSYSTTPPLYKGKKYYYFTFAQLVNGIPYYGNEINISIDADTGKLKRFSKDWTYDLTYPQKVNLSLDEVAAQFGEQAGLQLTYIAPKTEQDDTSLMLVYQGRYSSDFIVDAQTGELLQRQNYIVYREDSAKEAYAVPGAGEQLLTLYELAEVDQYLDLLSREEALEQVKSYFEIPAGFELSRANIMQNYDQEGLFQWSFVFSETAETDNNYSNLSVTLNAKTGELLNYSFYKYYDDIESVDVTIKDLASAQQLAEDFIEEFYPDLLGEVKLEVNPFTEQNSAEEIDYSLRFNRQIEQADYPEQGFYVQVDAVEGRVASFNINWAETNFPEQGEIVNSDEILASYFEQNPLELQYINIAAYGEPEDLRLAYVIADNAPYLDATTGAPLNYLGQPLQDEGTPTYSDLTGHWIEDEVALLQQFELLPFTGDKFEPNKEITCHEWVEMLYRVLNNDGPRPLELADLTSFAANYDLFPDNLGDFDLEQPLTRQDMAQVLVNFMGYQELSQLDIYTVPFTDANSISSDRLGAVAICYGLDIMTGINQAFLPEKVATRAQAVATLMRFLK